MDRQLPRHLGPTEGRHPSPVTHHRAAPRSERPSVFSLLFPSYGRRSLFVKRKTPADSLFLRVARFDLLRPAAGRMTSLERELLALAPRPRSLYVGSL